MAERTLLDKLKERLGITDGTDAQLLADLLEESTAACLVEADVEVLPSSHEFIIVRLAAAEYNQVGLEGEKNHSEGGVSHGIDLLPEHLRDMLQALRPARVVDT